MSHDKVGPKEQQLRELRNMNRGVPKAVKPPSTSDLRKKVAAIKPAVKGQSGRRGR